MGLNEKIVSFAVPYRETLRMFVLLSLCLLPPADQSQDAGAIREQLKPLNGLIGKWKGTAQPQDREAKRKRQFWKEESSWVWLLTKEKTGLAWEIKGSRLVNKAFVTWQPKEKQFQVQLILATGEVVPLQGTVAANQFTAEGAAKNGDRWRLTVRIANENRFSYTLDRRASDDESYVPVVETGNTREGVKFAAGSAGPECIVTGGKATITVTYKGKTYYVCCSGCKEAFEADPESFIKAAEKKKP
jgi:YHS domain-containing protein